MKVKKLIPELRFKGFDYDWNTAELNDFASINPKNTELPNSFIYIDLESVTNGVLLKEERIFKDNSPSRAQRLLEKNDILYQTVRPYQKNNLYFDKTGEYVASTGYAQIRTKNDSKFLFQFLHTEKFVQNVMLRCTGTSYPSINSSDLSNIRISFPSLPEQTKIASFLTAVDDKLHALKQKHALLEQYKKGVMQKIFAQELRFKPSPIEALEIGGDYPDWEEKKLGEVGEIVTGKTPSTADLNLWDGDIQFVTPTDIDGNKYQYQTRRTIKGLAQTKILPEKSIMFTCIASIGKMSLSVNPCVTNQQINSIIPYENYDKEFIYYSILNIVDFIKSTQSTNTLPIINKTDFSKFEINLPSLTEQTKIAAFLSTLDEKINQCQAQIAKTEVWKKGLLQQLFV